MCRGDPRTTRRFRVVNTMPREENGNGIHTITWRVPGMFVTNLEKGSNNAAITT